MRDLFVNVFEVTLGLGTEQTDTKLQIIQYIIIIFRPSYIQMNDHTICGTLQVQTLKRKDSIITKENVI